LGIDIEFSGKNENEKSVIIDLDVLNRLGLDNRKTFFLGSTIVKVGTKYFRPTEVDVLLGDPTKSKMQLGWEPKYNLAALVKDMVISDLHLKRLHIKRGCFKPLIILNNISEVLLVVWFIFLLILLHKLSFKFFLKHHFRLFV
jgi:GDPmannose 4,6-dehydratase